VGRRVEKEMARRGGIRAEIDAGLGSRSKFTTGFTLLLFVEENVR
jgi:hypothetical protein